MDNEYDDNKISQIIDDIMEYAAPGWKETKALYNKNEIPENSGAIGNLTNYAKEYSCVSALQRALDTSGKTDYGQIKENLSRPDRALNSAYALSLGGVNGALGGHLPEISGISGGIYGVVRGLANSHPTLPQRNAYVNAYRYVRNDIKRELADYGNEYFNEKKLGEDWGNALKCVGKRISKMYDVASFFNSKVK